MTENKQTDGTIIEFLLGSHSYEGKWFGEYTPGIAPYWWRKELSEYAAQFQQPTGDYEKEANKEFPNWGTEDNMRSEDNFTHNEIAMLERAAYIKGCMRNLGASVG